MGLLQGQARINTGKCLAGVPSNPGCGTLTDHSGSHRQDGRKAAAEQETGVRGRINLGVGGMTEVKRQEEVFLSSMTAESCLGRRQKENTSLGSDRDGAAIRPCSQQETQRHGTGAEDTASLVT